MRAATLIRDTLIQRAASHASEVLGKYPMGTKLRVYYPARNGWYAMYFKNPVKGSHYGWMAEDAVEVSEAPEAAAVSAGTKSGKLWVGGFGGFGMGNQGIGTVITLGGKGGYFVLPALSVGAHAQYMPLGSSASVTATGLLFMADGAYFLNRQGRGLYVGARGGMAMVTVSGSVAGIPVSGSSSDLVFGPAGGFEVANGTFRYGVDGSYLIFTGSSSVSVLSGVVNVKFQL